MIYDNIEMNNVDFYAKKECDYSGNIPDDFEMN